MDTQQLLDLETKSARISAVLDLRPELANIWRQSVAISEAAANLSMEDVSLNEAELLQNLLGTGIGDADPQALAVSAAVHRTLLSPGHLRSDPGLVFERAHRAGRIASLIDPESGGQASYPKIDQDEDWVQARELFISGAPRILRSRGAISLKAMAVSSLLVDVSPERHPIAERIIFMAAESYLRQDLTLKDRIIVPSHSNLPGVKHAYWTFTPAISLTKGTFRAWSPSTPNGRSEIVKGLISTLSREAGRIGQIHDWMIRSERDFTSKSNKSKRADLIKLSFEMPLLDAETVSEQLGCTKRTARNLLIDAEDNNFLRSIANRSSFRIWAIPALHELMKEQPKSSEIRRNSGFINEIKNSTNKLSELRKSRPRITNDEELGGRLDQILADIDSVMNASDALLQKVRQNR